MSLTGLDLDIRGRITYAVTPTKNAWVSLQRAGPRPLLMSVYYLRFKREKLLKFWNFIKPYRLVIDSGVHTFKAKQGFASNRLVYNRLSSYEQDALVAGQDIIDEVDLFAKRYAKYLRDNKDIFSYAFELDVDEFMGPDKADEYYDVLCREVGQDRIIRVWHTSRSYDDWVAWCEDPNITYVAIEGGIQHRRDHAFYNRFVKRAKDHGKMVHILAITIRDFIQNVPFDTVDSSTWVDGAKYALVFIPKIGPVKFGRDYNTAGGRSYWQLAGHDKKWADEWIKLAGFTVDELMESDTARCAANFIYSDHWLDIPYDPSPLVSDDFIDLLHRGEDLW